MLIQCPECGRDGVSEQARKCPGCGFPIAERRQSPANRKREKNKQRTAQARRAVLYVVLLGSLVWVLLIDPDSVPGNPNDQGRIGEAPQVSAAEIVDWNWMKDPDFGTEGAIRWNVEVKNSSSDHLREVKVEFVTYDRNGRLVSSNFTYVSNIPPGETRTDASFADLLGTEQDARVSIAGVYKD